MILAADRPLARTAALLLAILLAGPLLGRAQGPPEERLSVLRQLESLRQRMAGSERNALALRTGEPAYIGIGAAPLSGEQRRVIGSDFDWGRGPGPGGGLLVSFVDPDSEMAQRGVIWGDVALALVWAGGLEQPLFSLEDLRLAMEQISPGDRIALKIWKCGQAVSCEAEATPWPAKARERWPKTPGMPALYFPWLKDRAELMDYRAAQCYRVFRSQNEPLALKDLADSYFLTDRFAEAADAYGMFLQESRADRRQLAPALYGLALSARLAERHDTALEASASAAAADPQNPFALREWGMALYRNGQIVEALTCVENALALLPADDSELRPELLALVAEWGGPPRESANAPSPAPPPKALAESAARSVSGEASEPTTIRAMPMKQPYAADAPSPVSPPPAPSPESPQSLAPIAPPAAPSEEPPPFALFAPEPSASPSEASPAGISVRIHRIRSLLPAYPGARILLAFEYDLEGLAAGAEIPVSETIALCQNGVALKTWPRSAKKRAGKYEPHEFAELPRNLQPGTYELVARVAAGNAIAQASAPLEILGE